MEDYLFEIEGNKIVSYDIDCFDGGFIVYWRGSKGAGSFCFDEDGVLITDFMNEDFCSKFLEKIFSQCKVESRKEEKK